VTIGHSTVEDRSTDHTVMPGNKDGNVDSFTKSKLPEDEDAM
jgi:hypothetical protein